MTQNYRNLKMIFELGIALFWLCSEPYLMLSPPEIRMSGIQLSWLIYSNSTALNYTDLNCTKLYCSVEWVWRGKAEGWQNVSLSKAEEYFGLALVWNIPKELG